MVVKPLGIEGGILAQRNRLTILIASASAVRLRIPAVELESFTGKGIFRQRRSLLFGHGLRLHRTLDRVFFASVGVKGNSQHIRLCAAPNAAEIGDNIASACGRGFGVRAVCVVQLGGGDGDLMGRYIRTALCVLVSNRLYAKRAILLIHTGAAAGADVRTALGGVDGANSRYAAVHIHLRINQVVIGTGICLARRIRHGLKLAGATDKVIGVPRIAVIEIDVLSVCNRQASALGNIDLNARQQSRILIDRHIAGLNIDGNVVGDRQYVACRVDTLARKL